MAVWAQVLITLALLAVTGFLGNFAYSLLWELLKRRFGWRESDLTTRILRYATRIVPELIVLAIAATLFGWWQPIGTVIKDLTLGTPSQPLPTIAAAASPATTPALPPAPLIGPNATVRQSSNGDCSPNIIGTTNTVHCAPPAPKVMATQFSRKRVGPAYYITSFLITTDKPLDADNLRIECDGPVHHIMVSRFDDHHPNYASAGETPDPNNPNLLLYTIGPQHLEPSRTPVVSLFSQDPIKIISATLGAHKIIFPESGK